MFRRLILASIVAAPVATAGIASAESYTTRIEPRPYYGAVVTLEQGVRVWRPLPPTRHMIINPTNAPVNLNIADIRETHVSRNYFHGIDAPAATGGAGAPVYGAPVLGARRGHHSRPFPHHRARQPVRGWRP